MKTYELTIENDENVVYAISIVDKPAIESDFMLFSDLKNENVYNFNEEKFEITGPILIPNKEILRKKNNEFYNVFISESTIRQAAIKFFENGYQSNTTLSHEKSVNSTVFYESWIVENPKNDKANELGFVDLKKGTWFGTLKINDKELWNTVKNGDFNGFSIEGLFTQKENKKTKMNMIEKFIEKVSHFMNEISNPEVKEEVKFMDAKLEDGTLIRIDDETLMVSKIEEDGSLVVLADGSYKLEDGTELVVKDGKKFIEEVKEEVKVEEVKVVAAAVENEVVYFEIVELKSEIVKLNEMKINFEKEVENFKSEIEKYKNEIEELKKLPAAEKTAILAEPKKVEMKAWEIIAHNAKLLNKNK